VSLNQLLTDQPRPQIADSATLMGDVHVGAGAILAQGLVVRSHGGNVSVGNYSAVLENGVIIGTPEHPVRVGQRTVFGHRATIVGATIGDLCEIGNGAILMPGSRLGNGCILGEGTLVPPDSVIPTDSVLVGRPPHVIRSATDADRERLAVLRQHQTDLTDYPGTVVSGPISAGEGMGTLYAYRDKVPIIGDGAVLFDSAEVTGDVVIGSQSLIGAGVKIIGDSHGPVRVGSRVQILENTVLHLLPDNELIIDDDVIIGPGAMIHGCRIGRGSVIEPAAIVCDWSVVGAESVVRAGACVSGGSVRRTLDPRRVPGQTVRHGSRAAACAYLGPPSRCRRNPAQGAALTVSASHSVSAKRQSWEARDSRNGALRILPTALCGRESMTRISLGTLNFARTPRACSNSSAMSNCAP
jgi:carbonic anhydrase/acetyltransferase-like protein (isoleucine patch superfamily)